MVDPKTEDKKAEVPVPEKKPVEEEKGDPQPDAEEADAMEEDSDTELDEESDSDDLFAGLSAEQKAKMKAKMQATAAQHKRLMKQQKANDRENIRKTFKVYTECEDISDELVDFTVDFAQRHTINLDEKIANEGTLFLRTMREMLAEKPKEKKSRSRRRRTAAPAEEDEGSDWEAGKNGKKLSRKATKAAANEDDDGDWRAMEVARKAALAKERKKNGHKSGFNIDGKKRVGRLMLDEALKSKDAQTGWSEARKKAFKEIEKNPNAYYYRFNKPGEQQKNGGIKMDEHEQFMKLLKEKGANDKWGLFAINMPGRVGYQCSNYYRQLVKDKQIYDPNYWYDGKKLHFKRGGKRDPAAVKYAFTVLKDASKVWKNIPAQHPKKPAGLMSPAEAKKIAANPPDIAPAGFEKAAAKVAAQLKKNPPKRKRSAPAGGGTKKRRRTGAHVDQDEEDMDSYFASFPKANGDSDTEDETALPAFTDHFTKAPDCRIPAISPYGHVAEYDSWTKALRKIQPKDTCPFTKQPLKRRQLVKLTSENIEEYIDKIKNQDEAIKSWKAEQKKLAEEAEKEEATEAKTKTAGKKSTATA